MAGHELRLAADEAEFILRFDGLFADQQYAAMASRVRDLIDEVLAQHQQLIGDYVPCDCGYRPFRREVCPHDPPTTG